MVPGVDPRLGTFTTTTSAASFASGDTALPVSTITRWPNSRACAAASIVRPTSPE